MKLQALIFDCDGVLVDTEKDGHRLAFNMAFSDFNIPVEWEPEEYKLLVRIAGGKERIKYYFDQKGWPANYHDRDLLLAELHKLKTKYFMEIISSGKLTPRPGILRLIDESIKNGIPLAVCSTSNEKSVNLIVEHLLGKNRKRYFKAILAGDVVDKKKPDPEIYLLCKERLGIEPEKSLVVEDSRNGLLAAKAAGFNCLITMNDYTQDEDFKEADRIVTELGDGKKIRISLKDIEELIKTETK